MRHAALALSLLALAACSQETPADGADKFAGLDAQIVAWRGAIEAESPLCRVKQDGRGCQEFAVACKRERPITADEQARGVTAKLVAAMTFASHQADSKPGSAFAEFTRTGGTWTRAEASPVNVSTCEAAPAAQR